MIKILVVRRDNIGDLVCTTPLIAALRVRFPEAWLGALVNSYNAPVLEGNPDLNEAIAYTKLKHLEPGEGAFAALGARLASIWKIRRMGLDYAVLATPDFVPRTVRLARWLGAKRVVGFSDGSRAARSLDLSVPLSQVQRRHEVERVFALGAHLGIAGEIPPLKVIADPIERDRASAALRGAGPRIALHMSARRPAQRWPAARHAELIDLLRARFGAQVMLLWSPGAPDHPRHPGDDDKAQQVSDASSSKSAVAYRTERLQQLIGALAACDAVVCSDGGAMHLAAALGRPVIALFGDSAPERWGPWGVAHRVLRPASRTVADITPGEVADALASLLANR